MVMCFTVIPYVQRWQQWSRSVCEQFVQLRELFWQAFRRTGECFFEGLGGWVELVEGDQCLAALFFERHRGHGALIAFFVRPYKALGRRYFPVRTEERHRLIEVWMAEHEAIRTAGANVHVARDHRHAHRLGNPPKLEQFGIAPR